VALWRVISAMASDTNWDVPIDWKSGIRQWRTGESLTQAELASRSGLSVAAVRAYESGARRPSATALQAIIDAIGIPRDEASRILVSAGFAVDMYSVYNWGLEPASLASLTAEADALPWPAHVTNQAYDVVHANRAFQRIMEIDLDYQYTEHGARNLISNIVDPWFAERMANWDEVVTFMAGLAKADPRWQGVGAENPAPWLHGPVERLMQGDAALVSRFFQLWSVAEPIPHRMRQRFRLDWLYRGERLMRFTCVLALANIADELHWNEWAPADAETWAILDEISSS
jgi:transcriptional regulator with XRE-family HTH domain